jgi:hypothetical protein
MGTETGTHDLGNHTTEPIASRPSRSDDVHQRAERGLPWVLRPY